jgi:hypothetical protein
VPKIMIVLATPQITACIQKGIGNPSRSNMEVTLSGIEDITSLISSIVILSHSSSIARRTSGNRDEMTDFFSNDKKTGGLKGHTILCFDP